MKNLKFILAIVSIFSSSYCLSQNMKQNKPVILSKKVVDSYIKSGEAVYDSLQSKLDNSNVYKFQDGRLMYRRDDGKAVLWFSVEEIETSMNVAYNRERDLIELRSWISDINELPEIRRESLRLLGKNTGTNLDYSLNSIVVINKIKLKNPHNQTELVHAIVYHLCEVSSHIINGKIDVERIVGTKNYRPIVVDNEKRIYYPYAEYLKSLIEKTGIKPGESMDIELSKFKLR